MRSLSIPEHVHHSVARHGGSVLLNVRSGQWYAMNPVADALWQTWRSSGDFDTAVRAVAMAHPGTSSERIDADARALAAELAARGLLRLAAGSLHHGPADDGPPREPVAVPAVTLARHSVPAVVAFAAAVVLLWLPFRLTVSLTRWLADTWCAGPATPAQAAAANASVRRVARWYPGRAACLELSLAAVLVLAMRRRRADWAIGAAADPIRFHAWVEADGVPVVDDSDVELADFRRVLKI